MGGSSSKEKQPEKSGFDKFKTTVGWALLISIIFSPILFPFIIPIGIVYLILYIIAKSKGD